jgi:hypothetical protein
MKGSKIEDEQGRIQKTATVAYFKVLSAYLYSLAGTRENYNKLKMKVDIIIPQVLELMFIRAPKKPFQFIQFLQSFQMCMLT